MNEYFALKKQVIQLIIDKSVLFDKLEELDVAKKMLRDNGYRNFVSCSKIKQAEFFEPNLKMYKTAPFQEWCDYFEMDCRVSRHLMGNLIQFERTINSRITHHISEMMANNEFSNFEKNAIIQIISQTRDRKDVRFSKYIGNETWEYIPKMTFGEMKRLVFWLYDNRHDVYSKISEGYLFLNRNAKRRLDNLNELRNNLFHFTPLSVYLTENTQNYNQRKKVANWISKLSVSQEMRDALNEICGYSANYVKIKNSLQK